MERSHAVVFLSRVLPLSSLSAGRLQKHTQFWIGSKKSERMVIHVSVPVAQQLNSGQTVSVRVMQNNKLLVKKKGGELQCDTFLHQQRKAKTFPSNTQNISFTLRVCGSGERSEMRYSSRYTVLTPYVARKQHLVTILRLWHKSNECNVVQTLQ